MNDDDLMWIKELGTSLAIAVMLCIVAALAVAAVML